MNRKLTFFLIALVGIGLYALPSTTALFAGQHSFVNIDATGNQIECEKCHGDVKAELGGQYSTVTGTNGPHANFECAYCHRIEAGASSGDNAYALVTYSGGGNNINHSLDDIDHTGDYDEFAINHSLDDIDHTGDIDTIVTNHDADYTDHSGDVPYGNGTIDHSLDVINHDGDYDETITDHSADVIDHTLDFLDTVVNHDADIIDHTLDVLDEGDSIKRYLAIMLQDMEEGNYPDSMVVNADEVPTVRNDDYGLKNRYYALSPVPSGYEGDDTSVLTAGIASSIKVIATYSDGAPIDLDEDTRWGGLKLSASSDWMTVGGGSRAYLAPNLQGAGSEAVNPGSSYHAASLVSCMECHGGAQYGGLAHYSRLMEGEESADSCSNCHYGPVDTHNYVGREFDAGGFGLTVGNANDTGATEAHMEFMTVDDGLTRYGMSSVTEDDPALYASNGACVACHTHVNLDITYTKPDTLVFNVDMTNGAVEGLTGWGTNGSVVSNSAGT